MLLGARCGPTEYACESERELETQHHKNVLRGKAAAETNGTPLEEGGVWRGSLRDESHREREFDFGSFDHCVD